MAQNDSQDNKVVVSVPSKGLGLFSHLPWPRFSRKSKEVIGVIIVAVVVVLLGVGGYAVYEQHTQSASTRAENETEQLNEALLKGNKAQALKYAEQALANEPNNIDNILSVANLLKTDNPSEAKQYYIRALDEFKKQDNPDASGRSIGTYWAAAGLAEQAGQISQAKGYYQKVIDVANPSDSYDQSLVAQSQAALQRLQ